MLGVSWIGLRSRCLLDYEFIATRNNGIELPCLYLEDYEAGNEALRSELNHYCHGSKLLSMHALGCTASTPTIVTGPGRATDGQTHCFPPIIRHVYLSFSSPPPSRQNFITLEFIVKI